MVIHHLTDPPGIRLSIHAVEIIHQAAEDSRIGHLTADHSCLHLGTPEEGPKLLHQQALHFLDQFCPLIVKDLFVLESLELPVLSVSAGGVHHRKNLD